MKKNYKAQLAKLVGTHDIQLLEALNDLTNLSYGDDLELALIGELSDQMKTIIYNSNNPYSLSSEGRRFCDELVKQGVPRGVMNLILYVSWIPLIWYSVTQADAALQRDIKDRQERRKETKKEIQRCYNALHVLKPYLSSQDWIDLVEKVVLSKSDNSYFSDLIKITATPERYGKYGLRPKNCSSFQKWVLLIEEKWFRYERPKRGRKKIPYGDVLIEKNLDLVFKYYGIRDHLRKAGEFVALLKKDAVDYRNNEDRMAASSRYSKRISRFKPLS